MLSWLEQSLISKFLWGGGGLISVWFSPRLGLPLTQLNGGHPQSSVPGAQLCLLFTLPQISYS